MILLPFTGQQVDATFLRRPQRFLVDMALADGTEVVAYCSNPGSLHGCLSPGSEALLWDSGDDKRKRRHTWRAIRVNGTLVGTDTHIANKIVSMAITNSAIPCLLNYVKISREVAISGMRADFVVNFLDSTCIIEVKSATVVENGIARFPDSITPRGVRQLHELIALRKRGYRAVLLFVTQRDDAYAFQVTPMFDRNYHDTYTRAICSGVESLALSVEVTKQGIMFPKFLPILS